jgi:hypothetical protein
MARKKQLNLGVLISALVISALLFAGGMFVGYTLNKEKLSAVEQDMRDTMRDLQNFQLQFMFFDTLGETSACPLLTATLEDINRRADNIGSKLSSSNPDNELIDGREYTSLLKEYSRLLVSYWLLANKLKDSCDMDAATIIFFISKNCDNSNACDDQGFVLDYYKKRFENKLLIFTLSQDLGEPSILALKEYYNITAIPTLIIEGEKYEGFQSIEQLDSTLCGLGLCG